MSENDLPDNEDIKKKALVRLTIAGLVTAAALGGLWWLDQGKQPSAQKPSLRPEPAPIRPAQTPEPAVPQAEPDAEPPMDTSTQESPAEQAVPQEAPPPPRVSNAPRTLAPSHEPPGAGQGHVPAGPQPAPSVQPAPAQPPAVGAAGNFVVQLGVFADPVRATDLVRQLKAKGIRARSETRVHVGPFLNRQEAEKAQAEMRRLGIEGVVTTATPTK